MYELNLFQEGSSKVASKVASKVPARLQEGSNKVPGRFQQGSRTVPVFQGVHFRGTTPRPQRLKPNTIAVGTSSISFGLSLPMLGWKHVSQINLLTVGYSQKVLGKVAEFLRFSAPGLTTPGTKVVAFSTVLIK